MTVFKHHVKKLIIAVHFHKEHTVSKPKTSNPQETKTGKCPVCKGTRRLTPEGKIESHAHGGWCKGGGKRPVDGSVKVSVARRATTRV